MNGYREFQRDQNNVQDVTALFGIRKELLRKMENNLKHHAVEYRVTSMRPLLKNSFCSQSQIIFKGQTGDKRVFATPPVEADIKGARPGMSALYNNLYNTSCKESLNNYRDLHNPKKQLLGIQKSTGEQPSGAYHSRLLIIKEGVDFTAFQPSFFDFFTNNLSYKMGQDYPNYPIKINKKIGQKILGSIIG